MRRARPREVTRNPVVTELTVDSGGAIRLPAAMTNTLLGSQGNQSKIKTLRLARVMLPPGATGIYRIVVNTPPAVAAADVAATANDLGYVAIVPKTSKDGETHRHGDLTVDLDVTGQLPKLLEQNGKLSLSVVPMAVNRNRTQLTYQSVYLIER